jgi:hypothetical protein
VLYGNWKTITFIAALRAASFPIVSDSDAEALAWNASRSFVGRFRSHQAAARAISRAAVTTQQSVEAQGWMDDATGKGDCPGSDARRDRGRAVSRLVDVTIPAAKPAAA